MLWNTYTKTFGTLRSAALVASVTLIGACSSGDDPASPSDGSEITNEDGEAALSSLDALEKGVPSQDTLPAEGKADAVYPKQFDLIDKQSVIKSQGSRGVCSIFATTALMEHLYIAEGTLAAPDFSEQFLQWSVKTEVGAFTDTEGSSADRNIEAIYRFGIVEEASWPYETRPWSATNDPACTGGEKLPLKCYTNGEPPDVAKNGERFHIPRGRWINSSADSIKAFMTANNQAVVTGGTFFYQAWNHRAGTLPTNNAYWRKGYILYPNDKDKEESLKKRAGHAFLLVGWDDDLEVQSVNGDGTPMVDAQGTPVMQKGFFLVKNSWGKGSFGVENPKGDGYGWISMKYVKEFLSTYGSGLPEVAKPKEVCNDSKDNDRDTKADCDDSDCASDPACTGAANIYSNTNSLDIPDGNSTGIKSTIEIPDTGTINGLSVSVDITHSYRGDLVVKLVRNGKEIVLHNKAGAGEDNLKETYALTDFNGQDFKGTWELVVTDLDQQDAGKLNSWSIQVANDCTGPECQSNTEVYESTETAEIPDYNDAGASTNITVPEDAGVIKSLKVIVDIAHAFPGDLRIELRRIAPPGAPTTLAEEGTIEGSLEPATFPVSNYTGENAAGTWRLVAIDKATGDTGKIKGWKLEVTK